MSDSFEMSVDPNTKGNANLIYILYFVGFVVPFVSIAGVVMAYMGKGKGDAVIETHYNNQINIFWKFFLYMFVSVILSFVLIGLLTMLVAVIWYIIRNVKGIQALSAGTPIENPGSWWL
jgi:uncharacterized membrane protein